MCNALVFPGQIKMGHVHYECNEEGRNDTCWQADLTKPASGELSHSTCAYGQQQPTNMLTAYNIHKSSCITYHSTPEGLAIHALFVRLILRIICFHLKQSLLKCIRELQQTQATKFTINVHELFGTQLRGKHTRIRDNNIK